MKHLFLTVLIAFAADPQKYPDWPTPPVVPQPMPPAPRPTGEVATLGHGVLYVVQGDGNDQLLSSPPGLVTITELAGPTSVYGKFVDGSGQNEFRTYEKKQVFVVERVAQGNVELLKVPKGKVERRVLGDGTDPIPPPKPPEPKPPEPKPPEPVKSFRVIFIYESANAITPAMQQVMYSPAVISYLDTKTTGKAGVGKGWRRFDKDVDATNERDPDMKALWQAVKPAITAVPCVAIEVNGKADIVPFPASEAAALELFKKYAEPK